jgi:DNA-binding LacI/PurR family transcriptional regulator
MQIPRPARSAHESVKNLRKQSVAAFSPHKIPLEKHREKRTMASLVSAGRNNSPDRRRPATVSIRDVAQRAGVSIATVSRTVNRIPTVNPELAKRVWRAIDEVGYLPNTQARALVSGRSRMLGLIVSEITNPFFPELVQEFETLAVAQGYEVLIGSTSYEPARTESLIRRMLQRNVDGVAVMTFGIEEDLVQKLVEREFPLVFVDAGPDLPNIRVLKVDYAEGIRQGVQHLAALGHRRIAFITGPLRLRSAVARRDAFLKAMAELGLTVPAEHIVEGRHTMEGGICSMEQLIALAELPTAVMCSNDMTAIGVLHALYRTTHKVPCEISVVGFDDIHLAQFVLPPLTTVQMSCTHLAAAAIEALRAGIEPDHPRSRTKEWRIPTRLVVRQSTAFPRGTLPALVQSAAGRLLDSEAK